MLKALSFLLFLSYGEWFFRTYEIQAIYPFDSNYANPANADIAGLMERRVRTPDGVELILWEHAARDGEPMILYLPGNAGNLAGRAARFQELVRHGYGFVALSWRGSGGSGGKPDEASLSADALMIFDAMPEAGRVVIYGESLGTAAAVKIAAVREARAVVLESPFTSIPDLAAVQYPGEDLRPYLTQFWDSADLIGTVDEPLLVMHGTDDRLVPIAQGERMYKRARSRDKAMIRVRGRDHTGVWSGDGQKALYAFLDRF